MRLVLGAALIAGMLAAAPGSPAHSDGTWRDPVDVSPAASVATSPQVSSSADGKILTSVWIGNDGGGQRATGATSTDHGSTWSAGVAINDPTGDSSGIRLAGSQDGRRAVATFVDFQAPDKEIVRTATVTDGVWATPVDVSALASSAGAPSPTVAVSENGSRVVVVYAQFQGALHQIQSRLSTDSGASYGSAVPIAANVTDPRSIEVTSSTDGQRLVAVWRESISGFDTVRAAFSTNGGGTWSTPDLLSTPTRDSSNPDLITNADGTLTTAVWQEQVSGAERLIQTRTHSGGFWSASQRLSPVGQSSTNPRISGSVDATRATTVWVNSTVNEIQAARLEGGLWSAPTTVFDPGVGVATPDVASSQDGLRATVVWTRANNQIITTKSVDGGATWFGTVSLSATSAGTNNPRIAAAASGFRFAAVWSRPDGADVRVQASTYFEAQPQSITFTQPSELAVGSAASLSAIATSGLPVTLTSTTPAICSVTGSQLTALAPGNCTIVASQPGNIDFLPAADVTRTATVAAPNVRRQQALRCTKTPPAKLKRRGKTVVLPSNCRTDAGQRVTVKVSGKRKDLRRIRVIKKAGKTTIRTFGPRVRLTLRYRAAGTEAVEAFSLVRRYRT